MGLLLLPVAALVLGLVVGRWGAVAVPLVTWAALAVFLVLNNGWYGAGWGDFGIEYNVIVALLTVTATAVGVGVRRLLAPPAGDLVQRRRVGQIVRQ